MNECGAPKGIRKGGDSDLEETVVEKRAQSKSSHTSCSSLILGHSAAGGERRQSEPRKCMPIHQEAPSAFIVTSSL